MSETFSGREALIVGRNLILCHFFWLLYVSALVKATIIQLKIYRKEDDLNTMQ